MMMMDKNELKTDTIYYISIHIYTHFFRDDTHNIIFSSSSTNIYQFVNCRFIFQMRTKKNCILFASSYEMRAQIKKNNNQKLKME